MTILYINLSELFYTLGLNLVQVFMSRISYLASPIQLQWETFVPIQSKCLSKVIPST